MLNLGRTGGGAGGLATRAVVAAAADPKSCKRARELGRASVSARVRLAEPLARCVCVCVCVCV